MGAHVLVLGGGVGGSTVALELRSALAPEHRVTLVERAEHFVLGASLLWVIVGERKPEEARRPVAGLSARGVEVVRGEIQRIDPQRREVTVGGRTLAADHLVVALGADLDPTSIPGARRGRPLVLRPRGRDRGTRYDAAAGRLPGRNARRAGAYRARSPERSPPRTALRPPCSRRTPPRRRCRPGGRARAPRGPSRAAGGTARAHRSLSPPPP